MKGQSLVRSISVYQSISKIERNKILKIHEMLVICMLHEVARVCVGWGWTGVYVV